MSENPQSEKTDLEGGRMPFLEHLEELRTRLIRTLIVVFLGFVGCYAIATPILQVLMQPALSALEGATGTMGGTSGQFHFTGFLEPIIVQLKVAFLTSLFLTSPFTFYQLWSFVAPGLYKQEKMMGVLLVVFTSLFFVFGALFGYFLVFPYGFQFLLQYASKGDFVPMLTMNEYLTLATRLLLVFGVAFEMPVIIWILGRLGLVNREQLKTGRRYAIVVIFITSALITPPDPMTQCIMAGPMIILYEISVWLVAPRKSSQPEEEKGDEAAEAT